MGRDELVKAVGISCVFLFLTVGVVSVKSDGKVFCFVFYLKENVKEKNENAALKSF